MVFGGVVMVYLNDFNGIVVVFDDYVGVVVVVELGDVGDIVWIYLVWVCFMVLVWLFNCSDVLIVICVCDGCVFLIVLDDWGVVVYFGLVDC